MKRYSMNRQCPEAFYCLILMISVVACSYAQTIAVSRGTLLQFDFNGANPWTQMTAAGERAQ